MTPACGLLLLTLCACVSVFDGAPMSPALFLDDETSDKRGGVSGSMRGNGFHHSLHQFKRGGSLLRGNSFHNSLYPKLAERAPPTALRKRVQTEDDLTESTAEKKKLVNRDYFGTIVSSNFGSNGYGSIDHSSYNDHYYDDDDDDDSQEYYYNGYYGNGGYYYYYDEDDDIYVDDYGKRHVKEAGITADKRRAPTITNKRQDTRQAGNWKEKSPTVVKKRSPIQHKAAEIAKRKASTADDSTFLQALKRYLEEKK